MIGRRRFLTILAGTALTAGNAAGAAEWQGQALGADARILIRGGQASAELLAGVRARIDRIEAVFSLYRDSELVRLNRDGRGRASDQMMAALALARRVHDTTGGAFDPAVQILWRALAQPDAGRPPALQPFAGLDQQGRNLRLAPGQALTLNGIAQGIATDCVADYLAGQSLGDVLVDLGEARALRGDFRLELADPAAGVLGRITLRGGRTVATSSPGALLFPGGESHILGPKGQRPRWSTVSVEADTAALADAASTAFVLMDRAPMHDAAIRLGLHQVRLVDFDGNLTSLL